MKVGIGTEKRGKLNGDVTRLRQVPQTYDFGPNLCRGRECRT